MNINGTLKIFSILQDGFYLPVGFLTSNSFSEQSEMLSTTTRQNSGGWATSIPVLQSYTMSISGLLSTTMVSSTKLTYQELRRLKRTKTLISWRINDTSENYEYGQSYITGISESSEIDTFIAFSAELVGFGEPNNTFDAIYFGYKKRVIFDGGIVEAETCLKLQIEKLF